MKKNTTVKELGEIELINIIEELVLDKTGKELI